MIAIKPVSSFDMLHQVGLQGGWVADFAFLDDKISPDFIVASEGEQLRLRCTYCAVSPNATSLSWYKEGALIASNSRYVLRNAALGIPAVEHSKDEGLYECIVRSKNQNISRFITLIVQKDEINPLLSSVYAKNKSSLSVQIVWRLTAHGAFTSALVTLSLRLLNSSNWHYAASDTFQDRGLYQFDGLQPKSAYLLNVSLYNRHKETESKAIVFWSPTSNYSDLDSELTILYQVTNKKALGVALGIIGLLGLMMVMYACLAWSPNDKRGYSAPTEQQQKRTINENTLFSTSDTLFYNRAFEDEGSDCDWSKDKQCFL
ncbi:uncharacterized protein [Acropora muricata]|uniref:uncharacterized protein n=1 Tax=Acropora muricata TaxID=159855 RepID=UPI0034E553BE